MDDTLKYISDATKEKISEIDVVLPTMYATIFSDLAKEHGLHLDPEDEQLASEMLDEKIKVLDLLSDATSDHANRLSSSADKAIHAIEVSDTDMLRSVVNEMTALRAELDELKCAVYEDSLTKVYNRKWFNDNYIRSEAKNFNREGILAIIDMNYFKTINDNLGHTTGDKVLVFIAGQLKRTGANVVRYGGDEFLVLFEGYSEEAVHKKLHMIREIVIKKTLKLQDYSFKTSFSFGTVSFKDGSKLEAVIDRADQAMYLDKQKIKERVGPPL